VKCSLKVSVFFVATCCIIPLICQNHLTNPCSNQMPRTKADKCKVGLEYISELSSVHVCKSFSGGNTTCTCIVNYEDKLPQVKSFLKRRWKSSGRFQVEFLSVWMDQQLENFLGNTCIHFALLLHKEQVTFFQLVVKTWFFVFLPWLASLDLRSMLMQLQEKFWLTRKQLGWIFSRMAVSLISGMTLITRLFTDSIGVFLTIRLFLWVITIQSLFVSLSMFLVDELFTSMKTPTRLLTLC